MTKTFIINNPFAVGIGDFLLKALTAFSLAKELKYNFYIEFKEIPLLYNCFDVTNIPNDIINKTRKHIDIECLGDENVDEVKTMMDNIDEDVIQIMIKSHKQLDRLLTQNVYQEFFTDIIKPHKNILDNISNIYKQYNLEEKKYISVHVRCGDNYMAYKINGYSFDMAGRSLQDHRVNMHVGKSYTSIIGYIELLRKQLNLPVVVHTDSKIFKDIMKRTQQQYIYLDLDIQHTGYDWIGKNDVVSYISTLTEYFIMSKAACILNPMNKSNSENTYTGFSHTASFFQPVTLYITDDNARNYYKMFHRENIKLLTK